MRLGTDHHLMRIAEATAQQATCDRKHVGCVIARGKHILCTGYNGSLKGLAHCDDVGHRMVDGHCVRTVHAEANAVCQAAMYGISIAGATAYVTASPCLKCFQLLASSGISRVVVKEMYRDFGVEQLAAEAKIELVALNNEDND